MKKSVKRFHPLLAGGLFTVLCLGGLTTSRPSLANEDDATQLMESIANLDMNLHTLTFFENVFQACSAKKCSAEDLDNLWNASRDAKSLEGQVSQESFLALMKTLNAKQSKELIEATQAYRKVMSKIKTEISAGKNFDLYQAASDRAKVSSVKANMHTLQTIVETYAVDWGGVYAANMTGLKAEAVIVGREYWKEITNPYTGGKGLGKGGAYLDYKTFNSYAPPQKTFAGMVIYQPILPEPVTVYKIWGCDEKGNLIKDKGQDFFLTNS